jgi:hypothetical protein
MSMPPWVFVLTEPAQRVVYVGNYAIHYDKRKKTIKVVYEPGHPRPNWSDALFEAAVAALASTEGVEGMEEVRLHAANLIVTASEAFEKQITTPMNQL